jgi:hypothetical protein
MTVTDKVIWNVTVPYFVKPSKMTQAAMSMACIRNFCGSNLDQDIKCSHWRMFIFLLSKFQNGTENHAMKASFNKFSKYMFTPHRSTLLTL